MTDTNNDIETDKEREEGHVDTGERKFRCENKASHLECNLGIDVVRQHLPPSGRLLSIALLFAVSFALYFF